MGGGAQALLHHSSARAAFAALRLAPLRARRIRGTALRSASLRARRIRATALRSALRLIEVWRGAMRGGARLFISHPPDGGGGEAKEKINVFILSPAAGVAGREGGWRD